MQELAALAKEVSLCGLGKTAANPFLSTFQHFADEYEAHIKHRTCPARSCRELVAYYIDPDICIACLICLKECPKEAIDGGKRKIHVIDQDKCDQCGTCLEVCPSRIDAVRKLSGEPVPPPIPEEKRILVKKRGGKS